MNQLSTPQDFWPIVDKQAPTLRLGAWELHTNIALRYLGSVDVSGSKRWDRCYSLWRWQFRRIKQ